MFIECSACNSKYLINSADLKPDGRMVECATCNHQWYQELFFDTESLSNSASLSKNLNLEHQTVESKASAEDKNKKEVTNLPSTYVKNNKVSFLNSVLVIFLLVIFILGLWLLRSYGTSIFVLINYYINEFYFNFKLIISDIAKIIHLLIN